MSGRKARERRRLKFAAPTDADTTEIPIHGNFRPRYSPSMNLSEMGCTDTFISVNQGQSVCWEVRYDHTKREWIERRWRE